MKVAYITSSSFSGSTLLTFILNCHPKIGTISEFDIMTGIRNDPDYLCSCGKRIRACEFFCSLKKDLNEKGFEFEFDNMNLMFNLFDNEKLNRYTTQKLPLIDSPGLEKIRDHLLSSIPAYRRFIKSMHERNDAFMKAVLSLQNAEIFLDANKNPYRIKRLAENHPVLPIYLYKNGIAGAYSFYKNMRGRMFDLTFKQSCVKWFLEQININRVIQQVSPKAMLSVSYGQMCRETQAVANRIYAMCGVENYDISGFSDAPHHIVGNAMRVNNINNIKEKTDWKDNLSKRDVDIYRRQYDRFMPKLVKLNPQMENEIWYQ